jgi:anti-sigma factor RsiW
MSCDEVREKLLAYVENDPPISPDERERIGRHLLECADCRARTEALREQVALLRGAGEWAREQGASLQLPKIGSGRQSPGRLRGARARRKKRSGRSAPVVWTAAAAAALLFGALAWVLLAHRSDEPGRGTRGTRPGVAEAPGQLLRGEILRGGRAVSLLRAGKTYMVSPDGEAEVLLRGGGSVRLAGGSNFEVPEDFEARPGLRLRSGKLRCKVNSPLEVAASRIRARACGQFTLASAAPPPPQDENARTSCRWSDWLFPSAYAAEAGDELRRGFPELFLLEFGWAEVTVAGRQVRLEGRAALLGGDGGEPAQGAPEKLLADMRSQRAKQLDGLLTPRYRAIIAEYTARRARYVARLGKPEVGEAERADLGWRIALMDELRRAHAGRLEKLALEEGARLRRAELLGARISLLVSTLQSGTGRGPGVNGTLYPADANTRSSTANGSPGRPGGREPQDRRGNK